LKFLLLFFQSADAMIVKFRDMQEPRRPGCDITHKGCEFAHILREHFHAFHCLAERCVSFLECAWYCERMSPKNAAAVALGRKGGKATAENRTPEQRSEAARKAVEARWAKLKELAAEIDSGTKALLEKNRARRAAQARWAKQKKRTVKP